MRNLHCQNQNIPFVADFRRKGTIPGLVCFLQIKRLRVVNRRLLSVSRGVVNYINENLTLPNKPSPPGQRHIRSAPLKLQRRFKEMIFFRHFWQWFPLAFVAGRLQGHWWGFISRNYVVWPTFFLTNVFIAPKGSHFWFLVRCNALTSLK